MKLLISNGRIIDPASGLDQVGDIAIGSGRAYAQSAAKALLANG